MTSLVWTNQMRGVNVHLSIHSNGRFKTNGVGELLWQIFWYQRHRVHPQVLECALQMAEQCEQKLPRMINVLYVCTVIPSACLTSNGQRPQHRFRKIWGLRMLIGRRRSSKYKKIVKCDMSTNDGSNCTSLYFCIRRKTSESGENETTSTGATGIFRLSIMELCSLSLSLSSSSFSGSWGGR